jgi:hypothetical protein
MIFLKLCSLHDTVYFHVAYTNLTNFDTVLLRLSGPADDCPAGSLAELVVDDPKWAMSWDHLEPLSKDTAWSCEPMLLSARSGIQHGTRFKPNRVFARPFLPSFEFWRVGDASDTSDVGGDREGPVIDTSGIMDELKNISDLLAHDDVAEECELVGGISTADKRPLRKRRAPVGSASGSSSLPPSGSRAEPAGPPEPAAPPPPLPPPAPVADAAPPRKRRGGGVAGDVERHDPYPRLYHLVETDSYIRFVDRGEGLRDFKAFCNRHEGCTMTKTLKPGVKAGQGRPLGLMWAWFSHAHEFATKEAHQDKENWPDFVQRQRARNDVVALPQAAVWVEAELPSPDGNPLTEPPRIT